MSVQLKLKSHFSEQNWVLRPGELHYCFASLHALGKNIEGSGFDVCAVEAGIYSPTSLRQIYTNPSRAFTRAVEHHITMSLVLLNLKFEAALNASEDVSHLQQKCHEFKGALHARNDTINVLYEDVKQAFKSQIEPTLENTQDR